MNAELTIRAPRILGPDRTPYGAADSITWDQELNVEVDGIVTGSGEIARVTSLRRVGFVVVRDTDQKAWSSTRQAWVTATFRGPIDPELELLPMIMVDPQDESRGWSGLTMLFNEERFRVGAHRFGVRGYAEGQVSGERVFAWSDSSVRLPLANNPSIKVLFEQEPGFPPRWAHLFAGTAVELSEVRVDERSAEPRVSLRAREGGGAVSADVRIFSDGVIEVRSWPGDTTRGASLRFSADGEIALKPADGKSVRIDGHLVVSGGIDG